MYPILGRIGPITFHSYTVLVDVAILVGLLVLAWQGKRLSDQPNAWLDAGIGAVVAGIIGGRIGHVAIHRAYFSEHLSESWQMWLGGLDWHGALLLGVTGLLLVARLRGADWRGLTDVLSFVLPVGVGLTWGGCLLDTCGYGREVATLADYPAPFVLELPDLFGIAAPRFATQLYGIVLSILLLGAAWGLSRLIRWPGVRLWIVIALTSVGMFGIGYLRGDSLPMAGTLRLDQVLDLVIGGLSIIGAAAAAVTWRRDTPVQHPTINDTSEAPLEE